MLVVYIHGANATSESFTYIREHVGGKDIALEYSSSNGFYHNLSDMVEELETKSDHLFFIAHSLGGIYALHLADHFKDRTIGGITIATPYGGSKAAELLKLVLPFNRLMKDITPRSCPISEAKQITLPKNWVNIVPVVGHNPWMHEPNDGVVTIASMKYRDDMEFIEIPLNHYEAVISRKTVSIIKDRMSLINSDNKYKYES